jgi:hypothetical protein
MIAPDGKPKSAERIRASLESVHAQAGPAHAAGPAAGGMQPLDRLDIAAFYDTDVAAAFQKCLLEEGIVSSSESSRGQVRVAVDLADRRRATELLEAHLRDMPDRPPRGPRRSIDYALFGGLFGATAGTLLMVADFRGLRDLVTLGVFCIFGGLAGHSLDRVRDRYRKSGRVQIGLGDLLMLIALPALAVFLWQMVPSWLKS